jgi:hypothetical protein
MGRNDDETTRLLAFRPGLDPVDLRRRIVDDLPVGCQHRFEGLFGSTGDDLIGHLPGEPLEGLGPLGPVAGDIDEDPLGGPSCATLDNRPCQLLQSTQGRSTPAHQDPQFLAFDHHFHGLRIDHTKGYGSIETDLLDQSFDEFPRRFPLLF